MNPKDPIGIIHLGNKNLRCIISKTNSENNLEILGTSLTPSEGLHNDVVVNISKATNVIRFCIGSAEKKAKVSLKKINIVFEEPEFLCTKFSKHKKIDGSKINKSDIDFLLKEAKRQLILNDDKQHIIHIFNHNYIVDGKTFIEEPIGIYADSLNHEMTFISMPKNNLKNINQVFNDCDIEIDRLISNTFALGVQLFENKELEYGCILLDMGFDKISLGLFKNLALVHSVTLPVGANHISKDISKVCSLTLNESESIRNKIDFSFENFQNLFDKDEYLKEIYFVNSNFRKISKNLIIKIIKARLDEILELIKKQISLAGFNLNSLTKFVLSGEGTNLYNLNQYCVNYLDLSTKKSEENINNDDNKKKWGNDFASCLGAIKIINDGWETEAIPIKVNENIEKIGFFSKFFGNFK